jgi:hypothetical protein
MTRGGHVNAARAATDARAGGPQFFRPEAGERSEVRMASAAVKREYQFKVR